MKPPVTAWYYWLVTRPLNTFIDPSVTWLGSVATLKRYFTAGTILLRCPARNSPAGGEKTREMGFDSFPVVDQGAPCDLTLREDENASISSSMLGNLGRSRFRRSSIRNRDGCSVDSKNDAFDQKPAAKMLLASTRSRNGVNPSVSYNSIYKLCVANTALY